MSPNVWRRILVRKGNWALGHDNRHAPLFPLWGQEEACRKAQRLARCYRLVGSRILRQGPDARPNVGAIAHDVEVDWSSISSSTLFSVARVVSHRYLPLVALIST